MFFHTKDDVLKALGAFNTVKEISHQPETTLKVLENFQCEKEKIHQFTRSFLAKKHARIILTGAGTSAFAGNSIVNYLKKETGVRVEAIATTDLVSNPYLYFEKEVPTMLVSFARSGNSPESVEATLIANKLIDDCYHLAVTCNKEGQLYQASLKHDNYLAMLMPEGTNDVGFAMTSSFTSMITGTLLAFDYTDKIAKDIPQISVVMRQAINDFDLPIKQLADRKYDRIIYLGSGDLKALCEEASLKLLELTDGGVAVMYDSPLGFRHGPKSFINSETLVIVMVSNDPHTQKYDLDLVNEVRADNIAKDIITINSPAAFKGEHDFKFLNVSNLNDAQLVLPFIIWAQLFSVYTSQVHNISTDTPCASGAVNRVVQGVILHEIS